MNGNADPFMTQWGGEYYMTATTGSDVTLWRSKSLVNIATGEQRTIWSPTGNEVTLSDIWSPELHRVGSHWYVYFAADQNGDNATHRVYALKSTSDDPMGPYRFVGEIHDPRNQWMIDPTLLQRNGKLYLLWSGWLSNDNQVQRIMIAPMSSPTHISGPGVVISSPTYAWETSQAPINEGPVVLQHGKHTFIIYSANASWKNDYALGELSLTGSDPLNPKAWSKNKRPVFQSANGVYGPGRASFVTSGGGDKTQYWMVYHAARYDGSGWDRTIRAQPFDWSQDGYPVFGSPLPLSRPIALPMGEPLSRMTVIGEHMGGQTVFPITKTTPGLYGMYVRYENSTGITVTERWTVNGQSQVPMEFPPSSALGQTKADSVLSTFVELKKGISTVHIVNSSTGGVTVDLIQVTPSPKDGG